MRKMNNMDIKKDLLLEIKQLPLMERGDWKWLNNSYEIEVLTRKAAMIGGCWIPLSQLRADHDSKQIYVSAWFYKQELRNKLKGG